MRTLNKLGALFATFFVAMVTFPIMGNYLLKQVNPDEVNWLSLNIYHEARGESVYGQVAIANVVFNRVEDEQFPNTIIEVIQEGGEKLNRCQFSWRCDGRKDDPTDREAWNKSLGLARIVLAIYNVFGNIPDLTRGALFYYAPMKASPCWASSETKLVEVGGHIFHASLSWSRMKKLCRS